MKTKLDPVQIAARAKSKGRKGFGYYMEMGLGKTLTALDEFEELVPSGVTRMISVCPNSFKSGWREEVEKHGLDADVHIWESGSDTNSSFLARRYNRPPLLVINYEAIRKEQVRATLIRWMDIKPTYLAFDESIQLKRHDSQQTVGGHNLARSAAVVRLLSGKPTTQGPHDLWGQIRTIGLAEGRNFYAFRGMFCRMGGWKGKQVIGAQNEDILAEMLDPHVFWAKKQDWLPDLPEKSYTIREYEMSAEQRRQYASMERDFVLWLNDSDVVTVDAAITKYIKMAQIQAGFIISEDERVTELVAPDANPRINALLDILRDEIQTKVIVVYIHRYSFEILSRALRDFNPAHIKGGMEPHEIEHQKRRFNDESSVRVILVQERAGKYGHTLLGEQGTRNGCYSTVFFENSYSLDDRSQIEDRNHRRGQRNAVLYIDLVGTSLDKNVVRALQRKEAIFQSVFSKLRREVPT